ncbi:MAG: methylated-DNA--[protein]-cysteine S-methyltransferase [Burkholderiaceae bacterium]|nr:methylated-DNA--[protein]-cysteine S-methyltransferase [Burkholderiaceae bacterium]
MMYYTSYQSPMGALTLVASARGLAGVYFATHRHFSQPANWQQSNNHALFDQVRTQLDAYFAGTRQHFDVPLDVSGATTFQQDVWQALLRIPYGETASYAQIAQQIGRPAAVRAVGAANGRNPVSIIVPCHRVIASNGALTGYAGGLPNKTYLLAHEARIAATV